MRREYRGKRGLVFRLKYSDADGKQVMETVGAERDGWTHKKATAELRERLVRVERKGFRKPRPLTFADYSNDVVRRGAGTAPVAAGHREEVRPLLRHLREAFGPIPLASIRPRHVAAYVSEASTRLAANTIIVHVSVMHDVYECALREELVDANPARGAERPKRPRRAWRILTPAETRDVLRAYHELAEAQPDDRERNTCRSTESCS